MIIVVTTVEPSVATMNDRSVAAGNKIKKGLLFNRP
jgi:hypothetical protein